MLQKKSKQSRTFKIKKTVTKINTMKSSIMYTLILLTFTLYNCSTPNKEERKVKNEKEKSIPSQEELKEGKLLAENNCYSCHSPNASMGNRLAPPMIAIKKHYINENTSSEVFKKDVISFIEEPTEEKSKMPGAVRRFNLMPKLNFKEEQLVKILNYIYYSEIEKPEWFDKHHQEEKGKHKKNGKEKNFSSSLQKGQKIAMNTKKVLGKNLIQAINTKGTEGALSFCSTKAIPLTDSMAIELNAKIKRVSDKNRNPNNNANKKELEYIKSSKVTLAKGIQPKPKLTLEGNKEIGYYPIITNKMCLQCHGKINTEIKPETLTKIKNLYPNDLAVGYSVNELRGIWVVEMDVE